MIEAICINNKCQGFETDMSDNCGDDEIYSVLDCKDAICPPGLNICYAEDCAYYDQRSDNNCGNEVVSDVSQCRDWVRESDENGCWNCKHDNAGDDALCRQKGACNVPELELWEPIEPKEKEIILQCSNCKWRDVRDSPCMEDDTPPCIQPDVALWEPIEPTPWATYDNSEKKKERGHILKKAHAIINGERQDAYGNPEDCFEIIAEYWTTYLKANGLMVKISPKDVPKMLALMKIARMSGQKFNLDNYIDGAGYLGLAADIAEEC
jgi:hypothetical protein